MPQMEFYFSENGRQELFNFIQLKGGAFIPDILFNSDEYILLSDYEEFLYYQENETSHFFLIDNKYKSEPLIVSKNRFIKEPKYSINQRKGGPYIDFSFYRGYADDAIIPYKKSVIDIYSKFIHFNSHDEFKATDELKQYYKDIVIYIKSKSKMVENGGRKYWIGIDVLRELKI